LCPHDIRVATGLKHHPESYATRASIYEVWSQLPCRGARTIGGGWGRKAGNARLERHSPPAGAIQLQAVLADTTWLEGKCYGHPSIAVAGSIRQSSMAELRDLWPLVGGGFSTSEPSPMTAEGSGEGPRCHSDREAAATLAEAISRLPVRVSMLHTGAQPDDENNVMRSWLARGVVARTA
jgi:hypothetical protein